MRISCSIGIGVVGLCLFAAIAAAQNAPQLGYLFEFRSNSEPALNCALNIVKQGRGTFEQSKIAIEKSDGKDVSQSITWKPGDHVDADTARKISEDFGKCQKLGPSSFSVSNTVLKTQ